MSEKGRQPSLSSVLEKIQKSFFSGKPTSIEMYLNLASPGSLPFLRLFASELLSSKMLTATDLSLQQVGGLLRTMLYRIGIDTEAANIVPIDEAAIPFALGMIRPEATSDCHYAGVKNLNILVASVLDPNLMGGLGYMNNTIYAAGVMISRHGKTNDLPRIIAGVTVEPFGINSYH